MSQAIKQAMEAFNRLYSKTDKVVSYNRNWSMGLQGAGGAVINPDYRLILSHGEIVKTTDNLGRRVLFIGTLYGLLAINETMLKSNDPVQPLYYTTTKALSNIWNVYHPAELSPHGYLHSPGTPAVLTMEFLLEVARIADIEIKAGRTPNDGMRRYITGQAKPKKNPAEKKPAGKDTKQVHGRRHHDDQKNKEHRKKKTKLADPAAAVEAIDRIKVKDPRKKMSKPRNSAPQMKPMGVRIEKQEANKEAAKPTQAVNY